MSIEHLIITPWSQPISKNYTRKELVQLYKEEYYRLEATMRKYEAIKKYHRDPYLVDYVMPVSLAYDLEQAKIKYELALELQHLKATKRRTFGRYNERTNC